MENLHLFKATFMPQTNTLPTRIRIRSLRFKTTQYISRGDSDRWYEEATKWLADQGFILTGLCDGEYGEMYITSTTFRDIK